MKLTFEQGIFVIIAFICTLLPGMLAVSKVKSADDYSLCGRKAGAGLVAGSIIGTIVGGAATVGTAQLGFTLGLAAWWFTLGSGVALLLLAAFYAGALRNSRLTTVAEFLAYNYGATAGTLASIAASAGIFFSIVASMLTAVHLVAGIFNIGSLWAAFFVAAASFLLVLFGGLKSSGTAGLVKIGLIFATIFVGGAEVFRDMGFLSGMREVFTEPYWFSLTGHGVSNAVFNLAAMVAGVISTQSYVQAVFAARDTKTAARGCVLAALIVIPIGLPSVLIGMFMRARHPEISAIDALPAYLLHYLPGWLGGLGIGALLLSAFGSIAGLALGVGTLLTNDLLKKFWRSCSSRLLLCSRCCVALVIASAACFTCRYLTSTVLEWNFLSMALRASGVFLPLTCAVFAPGKIKRPFGVLAVAGGIAAACLWGQLGARQVHPLFVSLAVSCFFLLCGWTRGKKHYQI